jgi:hypothetical protein
MMVSRKAARKILFLIITFCFLFIVGCAQTFSQKPTEDDCLEKAQSSIPPLIILDESDKE